MFKAVIFCALFFISLQNTTFAQMLSYYHNGTKMVADTSTIRFVNSDGIFDGSTDYVELDVFIENQEKKIKTNSCFLINLNAPYYKIKNFIVTQKKLDIKYLKYENVNTTIKENGPWEYIERKSTTDGLYNDIIRHVSQNWQVTYDNGSKQGNSISVNPSTTIAVNEAEEVKPTEVFDLSWIGSWATSNGEMKITQNKDKMEILLNGQKLSADLINNKIIGKWSGVKFFNSIEREGNFQFTMSPNGKFITIIWKDISTDWAIDSTANRM